MALKGGSNEEKIWNYFKSKGLNDYGCAGLMGNLEAESGLKPNNLQNTGNRKLDMSDDEYTIAVNNGTYSNFVKDSIGYGIAQWTWHTRKAALYNYAKSINKSIADLEMQLEFLYKELSEGYKSTLNTLKNATSVLQASNAVLFNFERPADQSMSVQNTRAKYGQKYYDKYATKTNKDKEVDNMSVKTYKKGTSTKLSTNFKSTEFDCQGRGCCSETLIDEKLVDCVQKIRTYFGKSVTITSGYRCPKHNSSASVGGAQNSYHTKGQAADIIVKGVSPSEVAKYAESIGMLGIGQYSNFTHVDTRSSKYYWIDGKGSVSTFGGSSNNSSTSISGQNTSSTSYKVGKTYKTQVSLAVRSGAGTNYARKTYKQLTLNARKNATSNGYLKSGVSVSCLGVKKIGNDIWIRIPSGWCAAYYNGKYYIK